MWTYKWKYEDNQLREKSDPTRTENLGTIDAGVTYLVGRNVSISGAFKELSARSLSLKQIEFANDKTVSKMHIKFERSLDGTLKVENFGSYTMCEQEQFKNNHVWVLNPDLRSKLTLVLGRGLIFKFRYASDKENDNASFAKENLISNDAPQTKPAFIKKRYKTDISSLMDFGFTPRDVKKEEKKGNIDIPNASSLRKETADSSVAKDSKRLSFKKNDITSLFNDISVTPTDIKKNLQKEIYGQTKVSPIHTAVPELHTLKSKPETRLEKKVLKLQVNETNLDNEDLEKHIIEKSEKPSKDFILRPITKNNKYDVDSPQIVAIRNIVQENKKLENEKYTIPSSNTKAELENVPSIHKYKVDDNYSSAYKITENNIWPIRKNFKRFVKVKGGKSNQRDLTGEEHASEKNKNTWPIAECSFATVTTKFNDIEMGTNSNVVLNRQINSRTPNSIDENETMSQIKKREYNTIAQPSRKQIGKKPGLFLGPDDEDDSDLEMMEMLKRRPEDEIQETSQRKVGGKTRTSRAFNSVTDSDSDMEEFSFAKKKPKTVQSTNRNIIDKDTQLSNVARPRRRTASPIKLNPPDSGRLQRMQISRARETNVDSSDEEFSFKQR